MLLHQLVKLTDRLNLISVAKPLLNLLELATCDVSTALTARKMRFDIFTTTSAYIVCIQNYIFPTH